MKKSVLIILFFLLALNLFANPIFPPRISISELCFNEKGEWIIELEYIGIRLVHYPIDSIILFSSTGMVKLPDFEFKGEDGVYILRNDSLKERFSINWLGDSLTVRTYIKSDPNIIDYSLVYGNCYGAVIGCPRPGQSIWKYDYSEFYLKNNKPSIGIFNDRNDEGIYGFLEGTVF